MCGGGRFTGALTVQRAFINTTNCHSHPEWFYVQSAIFHAASRRSVLPLPSVVSFPLILADDVPHDPKPPESGHIGSPAAYLAAGDESVFVSSLIASIRAPLFSLVLHSAKAPTILGIPQRSHTAQDRDPGINPRTILRSSYSFLSGDRSWGESQNMLGSIPGFAGLSWDRSWDQLTSILPACLPRCQPQRAALWSAPCYLDCRTHTVRLFQSSYNYLAYKPPSLPLSPSSMRPPCSLIRGCPASRRAPVPASSCGCPNWCPTSSEVKALVK